MGFKAKEYVQNVHVCVSLCVHVCVLVGGGQKREDVFKCYWVDL